MGKIALHKKIIGYVNILIILMLVLAVYVSTIIFFGNSSIQNTKFARVQLANLVYAAENDTLDNFSNYEYAVLNLNGTVIKSNTADYPFGNTIDLHTLSKADGVYKKGDKDIFTSPIIQNEKQTGNLIVLYSEDHIIDDKQILLLIPITVVIFIAMFFAYKLIRQLKKDVFAPIFALHNVTNEIMKSNYDIKLTYDYDSEIGKLCHDFEILRDELKSINIREKQLSENEKLLLACISHDLKTPLAAISGYVEGIRDGIVKDSEGIKRYTGIIMNKIKLLSKLIDDILEHSKAELNEFSIETEEVYSKNFFEEAFNDLSIDVIQNGLTFEIAEIPNVIIKIDKMRIFQVLQNIISNSLKYTVNGGISVDFAVYDNELVISIKDSGKGIAATDIPFVFDKFYRGEKARTMNAAGSGLGLNISRYIVNKHGGKIECDSILDKGTTISFSLPI